MPVRLFIFLFCAILTLRGSVVRASSVAEASLWLQTRFSGKSCPDLTEKDASDLEATAGCKNCSPSTDSLGKTSAHLNDALEFQFFNHQAQEQLEQTSCEISKVRFFSKDKALMELRAGEVSSKLPFLKEQMNLATRTYAEFQSVVGKNNVFATFCRSSTGSDRQECFKNLDQKRMEEKALEEKWKNHRGLALSTMGSLWQGSTKSMSALYQKLARQEPIPSKEEIIQQLSKNIPSVTAEYQDNKNNLLDQSTLQGSTRVFSKLDDATKRQLLENALDNGYFKQAADQKNESLMRLLCRLEGKYTKGRDTLNKAVVGASFFLGGISGLLAKVPVAVRAGQVSQILTKVQGSAAAVGGFAMGLEASLIADSIEKSCFSKTLQISLKNSCPAGSEEMKKEAIKRMETDNCIFSAVMDAAPVGFLAGSIAVKALAPTLKKYQKISSETGAQSMLGYLKEDALSVRSGLRQSLAAAPKVDAAQILKNQREAQSYFTKKGLKVSEVKKKVGIDEARLEQLDDQIRMAEEEFETVRISKASLKENLKKKIESSRKQVKQFEDDLQKLEKTEGASPEEIKKLRESLSRARYELSSDQMRLSRELDELPRLSKAHDEKIMEMLNERLHVQNTPVEITEHASSIDVEVFFAGLKGQRLNEQEAKAFADTTRDRKVYTFSEIPKATPGADGKSAFWENSEFKKRYEELKELGVEVIIDPQKKDGAFYWPLKKAIYVTQDTPYHIFEHEFTHAQFDAYLSDILKAKGGGVSSSFRNGRRLQEVLPKAQIEKIGRSNVNYLQSLLQKYSKLITVDESLAVRKQLQSFGWRPIDSDYYWNKIYGGFYRVDEYLNLQKKGALSPEQRSLLNRELYMLGANAAMMRGSREIQKEIQKIKTGINNGKLATNVATWRTLRTAFEKAQYEDTTFFYNENGDLIRMSEKGSVLEYLNLKNGKSF